MAAFTSEATETRSPWVFIAVMGVTGSGKSTFIKAASGDDSVGVGDSLVSCTYFRTLHNRPHMSHCYW
jgi:ABC-type lipoprotein export system ATPase subunit